VSGSRPSTLEIERLRADVVAAKAERDRVATRMVAAREQLDAEAGRRRPGRTRMEQLRAQVETWQQRHGDHDHRLVVLTQRLAGARGEEDALSALGERHKVLTLALDLLVDRAIAAAADQPPPYLVDLLGQRPPEGDAAQAWDARARQVETWRHYTMGLAYGVVPAGATAPPSQRALGPVPADPTLAGLRARLLDHCQATLDLAGTR
jgi:hypothetical protein